MKKISILLAFLSMSALTFGQDAKIRMFIDGFFEAMYRRDTADLRKRFVPAASLFTYSFDSKGNPRPKGETVSDFLRGVSLIGEAQIEERLTGWQCMVDDGVASVWTPYSFYFEGKFSHCGVDSWQLIQVQGEWKITQLTDTRRKQNCADDDELTRFVIDSLMNEWHHAAAVADAKGFFGFMTPDAIYIGTDATERWKRDELRTWSAKYFERPSAWKFKTLSRNITLASSKQLGWFDELLDTQMGTCRSTGVVEKVEGHWKLVHYQLSLTVPNDSLEDFSKLIKK